MSRPTIIVTRTNDPRGRWYWSLWWDDGDNTGHGIGGWSRTWLGGWWAAFGELGR